MESSAVVRLALLFGSTWVVNAVVFSAVLSMIFLANLWCSAGPRPRFRLLARAPAFVLELRVPGRRSRSAPRPACAARLLLGLPVFFAALCFSHLFARERVTGYPLGVNLVGAMGGGLLEYASMALACGGVADRAGGLRAGVARH